MLSRSGTRAQPGQGRRKTPALEADARALVQLLELGGPLCGLGRRARPLDAGGVRQGATGESAANDEGFRAVSGLGTAPLRGAGQEDPGDAGSDPGDGPRRGAADLSGVREAQTYPDGRPGRHRGDPSYGSGGQAADDHRGAGRRGPATDPGVAAKPPEQKGARSWNERMTCGWSGLRLILWPSIRRTGVAIRRSSWPPCVASWTKSAGPGPCSTTSAQSA